MEGTWGQVVKGSRRGEAGALDVSRSARRPTLNMCVSLRPPARVFLCPTSLGLQHAMRDWLDASTFLVIFRVMCGACQVIAYMLKPLSRTNSDRDIAEIQPDVTPVRKA